MRQAAIIAGAIAALGSATSTVAGVFADNARRLAGMPRAPLERNPISRRVIGGWRASGSQAGQQGTRECERRARQIRCGQLRVHNGPPGILHRHLVDTF